MLQLVEVDVGLIHSTVLPALLDVKLLHQLPLFPATVTFPDFLEAILVEISDTEAVVK